MLQKNERVYGRRECKEAKKVLFFYVKTRQNDWEGIKKRCGGGE